MFSHFKDSLYLLPLKCMIHFFLNCFRHKIDTRRTQATPSPLLLLYSSLLGLFSMELCLKYGTWYVKIAALVALNQTKWHAPRALSLIKAGVHVGLVAKAQMPNVHKPNPSSRACKGCSDPSDLFTIRHRTGLNLRTMLAEVSSHCPLAYCWGR